MTPDTWLLLALVGLLVHGGTQTSKLLLVAFWPVWRDGRKAKGLLRVWTHAQGLLWGWAIVPPVGPVPGLVLGLGCSIVAEQLYRRVVRALDDDSPVKGALKLPGGPRD